MGMLHHQESWSRSVLYGGCKRGHAIQRSQDTTHKPAVCTGTQVLVNWHREQISGQIGAETGGGEGVRA